MGVNGESEEVVHISENARNGVWGDLGDAVPNEALYGSGHAFPDLSAVVAPEDNSQLDHRRAWSWSGRMTDGRRVGVSDLGERLGYVVLDDDEVLQGHARIL